jgi:nucleotide-binding universal stress UspA family protein
MQQVQRILVPVNGNITDDETLEFGCSVARRYRAEVLAIHVIEVNRSLPLDAELQDEVARGEQILGRAEEVADQVGYPIETELLQARDVGPAIVDHASDRNCDLIIMGVTYRKRFGDFYLGKTAPYVLKNAPGRVLVLRERPAPPQPG